MPHLTLEYTAGQPGFDPGAALKRINAAVIATGICGEPDIKSRAVELAHFRVGVEDEPRGFAPRGFAHVRAALLSGRTPEQRKALSAAILEALKSLFPTPAAGTFQLTVETVDMDRGSYAKEILRGG